MMPDLDGFLAYDLNRWSQTEEGRRAAKLIRRAQRETEAGMTVNVTALNERIVELMPAWLVLKIIDFQEKNNTADREPALLVSNSYTFTRYTLLERDPEKIKDEMEAQLRKAHPQVRDLQWHYWKWDVNSEGEEDWVRWDTYPIARRDMTYRLELEGAIYA